MQRYDPWGKVLTTGGTSPTKQNYTGQYLDDTGLLFYNARYYDPGIGRFVSADTVVPGNASGGMDGIALKPLTVSFQEYGFNARLAQENQFGPWFTLSDRERQQLGNPMGPANSQALNRYSYVMNNPLKYTDPSGHNPCGTPTPGSSCGKSPGTPSSGGGNGSSTWERFWNWLTGKSGKPTTSTSGNTTVSKTSPGRGVGGNGKASDIGDMHGMTRTDVDAYLRGQGANVKTTQGGYTHYRFADGSEIVVRPNGEVIRTPSPVYAADGSRSNKGARLDPNGNLTTSHNTGEMVIP